MSDHSNLSNNRSWTCPKTMRSQAWESQTCVPFPQFYCVLCYNKTQNTKTRSRSSLLALYMYYLGGCLHLGVLAMPTKGSWKCSKLFCFLTHCVYPPPSTWYSVTKLHLVLTDKAMTEHAWSALQNSCTHKADSMRRISFELPHRLS
jgi:hypothetical protein